MKKIICWVLVVVFLFLLLLPLLLAGGLLASLVAFLNPAVAENEADDLHFQAIAAVSARYSPENTLDTYLIKSIDLFHHGKIMEDKAEIERFIEQYFLLRLEREVEVTETVSGEEITYTKIEIYYLYKTFYESISMVREAPFNFVDGTIAAVVNLSMIGFKPGGGQDGEQGGSVEGESPPGAPDGGTLGGRYPAPVKNGVITCGYVNRVNPVTGKEEFHPALDIQGAWHSPITSLADGKVIQTSTVKGPYGNYIVVKHELPEGTFYSKYAHLSRITVKVGDPVKQLGQLGIEGGDPKLDLNPGWTTGHHVHLEIWTDQGHVNPADYIY